MRRMTGDAYYEDFKVGDCVITPSRTIIAADLALFVALAGGGREHRANLEGTEDTTFGASLANSLLTLAISGGLMFFAGERGVPGSTIALWGVEKVRLAVPTKLGDTLHVESVVTQATEIDGERGLLATHNCVKNQRGEEVLTYMRKIIAGRRPALREASHG